MRFQFHVVFLLGVVGALLSCASLMGPQTPPPPPPDPIDYWTELETYKTYPLPLDYQDQMDKAFTRRLKDPESRQVTSLEFKGGLVCGYVNAKNSYGGYVGAKPFGFLFDQKGPLYVDIFNEADLRWGVGNCQHQGGAMRKACIGSTIIALGCGFVSSVQ